MQLVKSLLIWEFSLDLYSHNIVYHFVFEPLHALKYPAGSGKTKLNVNIFWSHSIGPKHTYVVSLFCL
jgi:hypothetical protein